MMASLWREEDSSRISGEDNVPVQEEGGNEGSHESHLSSEDSDFDPGADAACATDAGYPRFNSNRRREEAMKKDHYCPSCDFYFSRFDLEKHFQKHPTNLPCQYCDKGVYAYVISVNGKKDDKLHHKCTYSPSEDEHEVGSVDMNQNS